MRFHLGIKKTSFLILCCFLSLASWAQSRQELEKQRKKKLEEIAFTQKLIDQTGEAQKKNLNYLIILQRQIKNREQLIETESYVLEMMNKSIEQTTRFIAALESDIEKLKEEYIEMAYYAYKNRSSYDYMLYVFASESLQEAWNRMRYVRYYNDVRANQIELIESTQKSLNRKIENLEKQIETKEQLLNNLESEKAKLKGDIRLKNQVLSDLKGQEQEYKEKLKEDKKIAKELDEAIEDIISAEVAKNDKLEISGLSSDQFATNRAKFSWPTKGIVSQRFGRQEHPTIPNVFITNNGIDIRTEKNAVVRSVFPGTVIRVVFIPGADNAIIVRHGDYFTVYKNLIDVSVKPGEDIEEGTELGKVSFDETSQLSKLHFEVRHRTDKLDPLLWLKQL